MPSSRCAGSTRASGTLPSSSTSASRTTSSGLVCSTHGTSSTANSTPASSRSQRRSSVLDRVEDEVVELLGAAAGQRDLGGHQPAAQAAAVAVAAGARRAAGWSGFRS